MDRAELIRQLERHPRYDYYVEDEEQGGEPPILIADLGVSIDGDPDHHPITRISASAIAAQNWDTIRAACAQGLDVDHVTRVTGYFSRVASWNRGKTAELKDRHRSTQWGGRHGSTESEGPTEAA